MIKNCGAEDIGLESTLKNRVNERISKGEFKPEDLEYIKKLSLNPIKGTLSVDDETLEKLRRMCQLWEVDLKPVHITSHRKFVGPIIVAAKKVLFSILRVLFKGTFEKQRDFNAAVISAFATAVNQSRERNTEG